MRDNWSKEQYLGIEDDVTLTQVRVQNGEQLPRGSGC